jgi:uncharacterized protein YggU (UPF0235/DUF167 family)
MTWHLAGYNDLMIVSVKVKPGVRQESMTMENGLIVVRVAAQAVDGKANVALIKLLSSFLDVPKSSIRITAGHASRFKRVELPDDIAKKLMDLVKGK